ncbi:hypothetical protein HOLleu_10920 [Holothuria leucospilota]|uniref:Uncharacterized protein n=1 Tax=Holothuria leucospilota TaxID=206669 RepID=A0A9Q1HF77_HOLLE|nr:hypothetical protein HOLleu_10920 [Holothuria leucospilota]
MLTVSASIMVMSTMKGKSPDGKTPGTDGMVTESLVTILMSPMTGETRDERPHRKEEMATDSATTPHMPIMTSRTINESTIATDEMVTGSATTMQMSTTIGRTTDENISTTDEMVTDSATTMQMSTMKGRTTDEKVLKQCYHCMSEENMDGGNECASKQVNDSKTEDCYGNCWITTFYGESDKFLNISRFCGTRECTNMMDEDGFDCQDIEKDDDITKICTYCCSTDKCNGMSVASYLRHNVVMLIVVIIVNGLVTYKFPEISLK